MEHNYDGGQPHQLLKYYPRQITRFCATIGPEYSKWDEKGSVRNQRRGVAPRVLGCYNPTDARSVSLLAWTRATYPVPTWD